MSVLSLKFEAFHLSLEGLRFSIPRYYAALP
jgi:hypothetical protein